ncbi:MAG: PDZ domain-containing protein [Planctomycetales bacterium]|nr:PDZ domain-containing protein [Planctomycetales bacterium]
MRRLKTNFAKRALSAIVVGALCGWTGAAIAQQGGAGSSQGNAGGTATADDSGANNDGTSAVREVPTEDRPTEDRSTDNQATDNGDLATRDSVPDSAPNAQDARAETPETTVDQPNNTNSREQNPTRTNQQQRAALGVALRPVRGGLMIQSVEPNGPAAQVGLRPGDVIVALDDVEITSFTNFANRIANHEPGQQATIVFAREGRTDAVDVQLMAANRLYGQSNQTGRTRAMRPPAPNARGIEGDATSADLRQIQSQLDQLTREVVALRQRLDGLAELHDDVRLLMQRREVGSDTNDGLEPFNKRDDPIGLNDDR